MSSDGSETTIILSARHRRLPMVNTYHRMVKHISCIYDVPQNYANNIKQYAWESLQKLTCA